MLEVDLYFDNFIQKDGFEKLVLHELYSYEELLGMNDWDLLLLFQGKKQLSDSKLQIIVEKIRSEFKYI